MVISGVIPDFQSNGHLPPGRYRTSMDGAEALLVDHDRFFGSDTRRQIWDDLTRYLLMFEGLEQRYGAELRGRSLISHLWIGGSFASAKVNPNDIDVTVFTDAEAIEDIKLIAGNKWLAKAFNRRQVIKKYKVEPFQVNYWPVLHVLGAGGMTVGQADYFRDRGRYDDWWQRLAPSAVDKGPPTADSCLAARGYLEVIL